MKKLFALLLALIMTATMFTGCFVDPYDMSFDEETGLGDNTLERPDIDIGKPSISDPNPADSPVIESTDKLVGKNGEDISYVLIYNPNIYDENSSVNKALNTGSLASQIDVDAARGETLETPKKSMLTIDQGKINAGFPFDKSNLEGNRGEILSPSYSFGDKAEFYAFIGDDIDDEREKVEFTCSYAGRYCNIWTYDVNLYNMIEAYGMEFDNNIYSSVINNFGKPRFDGKINLMFYSMPECTLGCFAYSDIIATGEFEEADVYKLGINLNHNMVHINADYAVHPEYKTAINGTMAHEFQHLICGTNLFETVNGSMVGVWINEAMSGYIEENLYPGTKAEAGHLDDFYNGATVKHGQSMYNFNTDNDIGVYGSVYMFSEYLANLAGKDVFYNFHEYWRSSYSETLDDAEAIANAVPQSIYEKINSSINYPSSIIFKTSEQEWMSKLMLDFYVSIIKYDINDPDAFKSVNSAALLYDEINEAKIEGGGRIFIATNENTFSIPSDADRGLIYVGLNSDFDVVTDYIYH